MIPEFSRRFVRSRFFLDFTVLLIIFLLMPLQAGAVVLGKDTVWDGEVDIHEDIVVPRGVTLTVQPGTAIRIWPAESTKTDPEYLSHMTEITVRLSTALADRYRIERHLGEGGMANVP